jgi:hypothetical protein
VARFWKERRKGQSFAWCTIPPGYFPEHFRSVVPLPAEPLAPRDRLLPMPFVYCVEVLKFTFRFHTIAEMVVYRDYFAASHFPSQRRPNPRRAKNTGDRRRTVQTRLSRVPLRLKTKARRGKVARALDEAIRYFNRAEPRTAPGPAT